MNENQDNAVSLGFDDKPALKFGDLTEKVIGVFYAVYNELGNGFLESVYEESLAIALRDVGLQVQQQLAIPVSFRGHCVGEFRADIAVENTLLLEIKTARALDAIHEAQLLHYLKATPFEIGLLLNFGPRPQFRRLILDNIEKQKRVAKI
jgi:GxxExxY protein